MVYQLDDLEFHSDLCSVTFMLCITPNDVLSPVDSCMGEVSALTNPEMEAYGKHPSADNFNALLSSSPIEYAFTL